MARQAAPLLDRFSRPIFPGVQVEFHPRLPMVYRVVDVKPVVDPRQPAGLWQITLAATVNFNAIGGVPIEEVTAVVFPKAVDVDRKPDEALPQPGAPDGAARQDDDSPAGPDQYHPPDEPERGGGDGT